MRRVPCDGRNVVEEAIRRFAEQYRAGHRIVVAFSGGKDSTVMLECAIIAARQEGKLPVDVWMRDDEIMFPGTFEYCERVAARPEVEFFWAVAGQPFLNVFNREMPFVWAFDDRLKPEQWLRIPPPFARWIKENSLAMGTTRKYFPTPEGKDLIVALGLRATESFTRLRSIATGGLMTKPMLYERKAVDGDVGTRRFRPICDWLDGDVWKMIKDYKLDYCSAYDVLARHGVPQKQLRLAPPTQNGGQAPIAQVARQAWPGWFDRVSTRCPGFRTVANFGLRAVMPQRRKDETWEQCFHRTCIDTAPAWIRDRSIKVLDAACKTHARHSTAPFCEVKRCQSCKPASWKQLAQGMYLGDPYSTKQNVLPEVEPEFFRKGAGYWGTPRT